MTIAATRPPATAATSNDVAGAALARASGRDAAEAADRDLLRSPGPVAKADGMTGSGFGVPAAPPSGDWTPSAALPLFASLTSAAPPAEAFAALSENGGGAEAVSPSPAGLRPTSAAGRSMVIGFRCAFCAEVGPLSLVDSFAKNISVESPDGPTFKPPLGNQFPSVVPSYVPTILKSRPVTEHSFYGVDLSAAPMVSLASIVAKRAS